MEKTTYKNTRTHEIGSFKWNEKSTMKLGIFAKIAFYLFKMICWVELSLKRNQIKFSKRSRVLLCACYVLVLYVCLYCAAEWKFSFGRQLSNLTSIK